MPDGFDLRTNIDQPVHSGKAKLRNRRQLRECLWLAQPQIGLLGHKQNDNRKDHRHTKHHVFSLESRPRRCLASCLHEKTPCRFLLSGTA